MWEQGTHLLLSKRRAWQRTQLRGPILNEWESYPRGHLGSIMAESTLSFLDLLSCSAACLFWFSPFRFEDASSGRATLTNGQTGVISSNTEINEYQNSSCCNLLAYQRHHITCKWLNAKQLQLNHIKTKHETTKRWGESRRSYAQSIRTTRKWLILERADGRCRLLFQNNKYIWYIGEKYRTLSPRIQ